MSVQQITEFVTSGLRGQFRAALSTLEQSIERSDAETWAASHPDQPVNRAVFHSLFYTDLYLDWGKDVFREQAFHAANAGLFQDYEELEPVEPRNFYAQDDCRNYLEFCRQKVDAVLGSESMDVLQGDCGFPRRKLSRLELHVYNIRHIQHHAAQLGLRSQLSGGDSLDWVGKA